MCKRKKCLSLLLAAAMLLTLSIPAFAKADSGDSVTHVHEYNMEDKIFIGTAYEAVNATSCSIIYKYSVPCEICGELGTFTETVKIFGHAFQGVSATCNGAKQTLLYVCGNCGYRKTELKICPAAGHGNSPCPALPF